MPLDLPRWYAKHSLSVALAVAIQQRSQLGSGRKGDGRRRWNGDGGAGLRVLDGSLPAQAFGESSEARIGQLGVRFAADPGADEVIAHLGKDRIDDLADGLLGQLARQVLL